MSSNPLKRFKNRFNGRRAQLTAIFAVVAAMAMTVFGQDAETEVKTQPTPTGSPSLQAMTGKLGYQSKRQPDGRIVEIPFAQKGIMVDDVEESIDQRNRREARLLKLLSYTHENVSMTREIQKSLPDAGRPDGKFAANTASAVLNFLKNKPDQIKEVAPYVLERMLSYERDATMALVQSSTSAKTHATAKIKSASEPTATRQDRYEAQIWLAAFGTYAAAFDGIRADGHIAAEKSFMAFNAPNAPQLTPRVAPPPPAVAKAESCDASTPLNRADITALQKELNKCGLNVTATGTFDSGTAGALMTYLEKNKGDIPRLSAWMVQQLLKHGNQSKLSAMIVNDETLMYKVSERLKTSIQSYGTLQKQDMVALQTWMKALGVYNGPLNGVANKATENAADTLNFYIGTTDIAMIKRQQDRLIAKPTPRVTPDNTPPAAAPIELDERTVAALATNKDFRQALISGNTAKYTVYLEAIDTTPLILKKPIHMPMGDSDFGMRFHPVHHTWLLHQGQDYAAAKNTPVIAAADGRVIKVQWFNGYGNTVTIDHGRGVQTLSGHLNNYNVKVGDYVTAGQKIGGVGNTGTTTRKSGRNNGYHLHHEIMLADHKGFYRTIDTVDFMGRDLGDSKVRVAALSDAFNTARKGNLRDSATISPVVAKRENIDLTPRTARTLLQVLESSPSLTADVHQSVVYRLNRMGLGRDLTRLAQLSPQ